MVSVAAEPLNLALVEIWPVKASSFFLLTTTMAQLITQEEGMVMSESTRTLVSLMRK
jgi:hypothetical protein